MMHFEGSKTLRVVVEAAVDEDAAVEETATDATSATHKVVAVAIPVVIKHHVVRCRERFLRMLRPAFWSTI
jgi:hypothetical protein